MLDLAKRLGHSIFQLMDTEEDPSLLIPKLPNDLIIEVLTRLPVKPLSKFKCVCKSWRTLISSQQFAKIHLGSSKLAPNFIINCRGNFKQCSVNSMLYEPASEAFDLRCPAQFEINSAWVAGSCNGLICLSSLNRTDLILWNPSTRICKKLPDFGVKINGDGYFVYGLGFDKSSDDYKVVVIFNNRDLSGVIVQVYSLSNDEWKNIKSFKGHSLMSDPATFANGKLYWIANYDYELELGLNIVSLDLEKEEFGILQIPSYVKGGYYSRLGESEGCLYVLCSHLTSADLWIMDSLENENWIKFAAIPFIDDFLKYTYKKALYVLKNGQVLLLCGSTFVIFDPKDCLFRYPAVRNLGEFVGVTAYLESLVAPLGY